MTMNHEGPKNISPLDMDISLLRKEDVDAAREAIAEKANEEGFEFCKDLINDEATIRMFVANFVSRDGQPVDINEFLQARHDVLATMPEATQYVVDPTGRVMGEAEIVDKQKGDLDLDA